LCTSPIDAEVALSYEQPSDDPALQVIQVVHGEIEPRA
jgi:hypothetical protein